MLREERNKQTLLGELRYRYFVLCVEEVVLRILQVIGMGSCFLFVWYNCLGMPIGDIVIATQKYTFIMRGEYWSSLCFILSVLLIIPIPKTLHEKITVLGRAIKFLTKKNNLSTHEESIVVLAKTYRKEIEIYHQKRKEGREGEIKPHERRMVMRRNMIVLAIPGMVIITALLILVFGFTFPQVAAIDMVIGYILVMLESIYYQKQLKNAHIAVMTDNHKKIVETKLIQEKQYKFFQKIFYMQADRYSNYCMVLGVASSVLNMLAILLTLLDASSNEDLKRLFAIDSVQVNNEISVLFMVVSITLYFLNIFFNSYFGPKIVELKAKENMEYSIANYESLLEDWMNRNKNRNTIFSRNALDVCRGKYDYNNDMLVEGKGQIPAECMSTVEDSFPGRVPRFKFTAFVIWMFLFCFLVWGGTSIAYIIPISIVSLVFYDISVLFFAVLAWNKNQKWILFEKEMEIYTQEPLTRTVKWDFLSYYLGHSFIVLALLSIDLSRIQGLITYNTIVLIFLFALASASGYWLAKKKKLVQISQCFIRLGTVALSILGTFSFAAEKNFDIFNLLVLAIIIPAFIEMLNGYYRKTKEGMEGLGIEIPLCYIFLVSNWVTVFVLLYLEKSMQNNYATPLLSYLYITIIILVISYLLFGLKQICDKKVGDSK